MASAEADPDRRSPPGSVGIVAVTFQSAGVVPGLLASLPAATRGLRTELVVVDNASTDDTLIQVAAHAPQARVIQMGRNAGYAAALNAGAAELGSCVAVLVVNPDVRFDPDAIVALHRALSETGAGVVTPRLVDAEGRLQPSLRRRPAVHRAWAEALMGGHRAGRLGVGELVTDPRAYRRRTTAAWASGCALLIDRRCLDDVGPWDERFFLYSEETDFCLRARELGWATLLVPEAGAVHLGGEAPSNPSLWALLVRNRAVLATRRMGRPRARLFTAGLRTGAALRMARTSSPIHRAARDALATPPPPENTRPGRRAPHALLVVENLPVPLDRRVWLEAQALRAAGWRVSVISPRGPHDSADELLAGVRILRYRAPAETHGALSFIREFVWCWLATAALTLRILRDGRIDVIQACNPPDTFFALAALLKPFGTRFVYDQHDLCPEIYRSRFGRETGALLKGLYALERWSYRTADHVIATNESYRAVALRRGGVDVARTSVVRNGPDLSRLYPVEPDPALRRGHRHLCVYLGIMGPQDGVDGLIEAAACVVHELARDDIGFALLGFGDALPELQRLARTLELDRHVEFTGRADDEMIRAYLSTADVGCSPDPPTPFNDASTMNKTMEYMAFGLPVLAFDLHETRVSAGEAARYVSVPEPAAYAKELVALLADPRGRASMGAIGRRRVLRDLRWEIQRPGYVEAFERLAPTHRSSTPLGAASRGRPPAHRRSMRPKWAR